MQARGNAGLNMTKMTTSNVPHSRKHISPLLLILSKCLCHVKDIQQESVLPQVSMNFVIIFKIPFYMLLTTQLGILQDKITVPERYATFSFKIGNTSIAFISSFLRNPEKKKREDDQSKIQTSPASTFNECTEKHLPLEYILNIMITGIKITLQ